MVAADRFLMDRYRLIGNAKAYGQVANGKAPIYAATDFTGSWHLVGGECSNGRLGLMLPRL